MALRSAGLRGGSSLARTSGPRLQQRVLRRAAAGDDQGRAAWETETEVVDHASLASGPFRVSGGEKAEATKCLIHSPFLVSRHVPAGASGHGLRPHKGVTMVRYCERSLAMMVAFAQRVLCLAVVRASKTSSAVSASVHRSHATRASPQVGSSEVFHPATPADRLYCPAQTTTSSSRRCTGPCRSRSTRSTRTCRPSPSW